MYDRSRDVRPESRLSTRVGHMIGVGHMTGITYMTGVAHTTGVGHTTEVAIQSESSYNRSHVFQLELGL
jgi:hypothetical protein